MTSRQLCLLILVCICTAGLALGSQDADTGRIDGRIVNQDEGVGGVTVRVLKTETVVFSDEDGRFVIPQLPTGNQTLLLSLGDDEMARIVKVETGGKTTDVEIQVDWIVGRYETVKVTPVERAGKIVDAPAAVTVVSEEDIEREASHGQLPKVLEYTPGAEVTQSGLYDFNFNTRGFNSSLNRRVSTYIDGRDVGVPLLGAQEWGALSIPLDDLAALEFIRGPSAALYGANASSGVVKMTTKAPRESMGGMARITLGELDTRSTDIRWADEIGGGWYYKILAGFRDTGDFSISRDPCPEDEGECIESVPSLPPPEYSYYCDKVGEAGCLQQERTLVPENDNDIRFGSLRVDKYLTENSLLTFETATTDIEGPVFQTGIGRVQIVEAKRPWARVAYSHPRFNILAHWANREGHQVTMAKALRGRDFELFTDTLRYGIEAQTNWNFFQDKLRFVIGAAHTKEEIDSKDPVTGEQTVIYNPVESDRQAIFSQLDWKINDHFKLVFAGRSDWNTLHDTQFSPKMAVVASINPKHSFRVTFNKAFQVANYSEFYLHTRLSTFTLFSFAQLACQVAGQPKDCTGITDNPDILAVGNDDLRLEKTQAWEVGYSAIIGGRTFLTVDYYNSQNKDFITDLVAPYETSLGSPINPDYPEWGGYGCDEKGRGPNCTETLELFPNDPNEDVTIAEAVRGNVKTVLGSLPFGMRLSWDLDGTTPIIVGRTYSNVGNVDTQGVDMGLQVFFNDNWGMQLSYSWFDFDILGTEEDVKEILLPNSPEHKASASVSFRRNKWEASLGGRWVDDFLWSAGVFQGNVQAYWTSDLAVNWAIREDFRLGFNVANVSDNVHRQTFGGDLLSRRALLNATYYW